MTSRTWFPTWLVIGCAWFFSAPPIEAQTAAGQITGLVKDQAGAPVPGATVTVTETRTNLQRVVVSTSDGVYTVPSLPPGEYRLEIGLYDPATGARLPVLDENGSPSADHLILATVEVVP